MKGGQGYLSEQRAAVMELDGKGATTLGGLEGGNKGGRSHGELQGFFAGLERVDRAGTVGGGNFPGTFISVKCL